MSELKIYNFMGLRRIALVFSAVLLLVSIGSLSTQGLVLGLDFSGGTQVEVGYQKPVNVAELRDQLKQSGFDDPVVVHFGSESDVLIRMQGRPCIRIRTSDSEPKCTTTGSSNPDCFNWSRNSATFTGF